MVKDIQNAWNNLEGAEKGFEDWLLSEMMRLERYCTSDFFVSIQNSI